MEKIKNMELYNMIRNKLDDQTKGTKYHKTLEKDAKQIYDIIEKITTEYDNEENKT